jgi:hypothetical protein
MLKELERLARDAPKGEVFLQEHSHRAKAGLDASLERNEYGSHSSGP